MKTVIQVISAIACCMVLSACQEKGPSSRQTISQTDQSNSAINGFYRSGVFITDGSDGVLRDASIHLRENGRRLNPFDTSVTLRDGASSTDDQPRAIAPVWSDYRHIDYDENGNLISLEVFIDSQGDESSLTRNVEYDAAGKLVGTTKRHTRGMQWKI